MCSYNCQIKKFLLSYLWDKKGSSPASFQSLCKCSLAVKEWDHSMNVDINHVFSVFVCVSVEM